MVDPRDAPAVPTIAPPPGRRRRVRPAVVWLTGLSGAGKSTIAEHLCRRLRRRRLRVEWIDGDAIRHLFPTGFTRPERDSHIRRVGYMASVLERHGVFVVASFVSPYAESRNFIRNLCQNFIEVYVATALEECERRDVKGLYAKARRGEIKNFTGIDDPYESPEKPDVVIEPGTPVREAADAVLRAIGVETGGGLARGAS